MLSFFQSDAILADNNSFADINSIKTQTMKFRNTVFIFLAWAAMIPLCHGQDADQLIFSLNSSDSDWQKLFADLQYSATVSIHRGDRTEPDEVFKFDYNQTGANRWRLDLHRNSPGSLVRDDDFWFSVAGQAEGRYDRLGFDDSAAGSIGASLISQNTLLASATHLLDIPLSRFVTLPEIQWQPAEAPINKQSLHRLRWVLTPEPDGEFLPAFGTIEWVVDQNKALLTHYEYFFGTPDKNEPKGVVVDVLYDRFEDRLLPMRSTRHESGVKTITQRDTTSAANTNLDFYDPASFGLVRPARPWQGYQIWLMVAVGAAAIGISVRRWRMNS